MLLNIIYIAENFKLLKIIKTQTSLKTILKIILLPMYNIILYYYRSAIIV